MSNTHVATIHDTNGTIHIGEPIEFKDAAAVREWVGATTDAMGNRLETLKLESRDLITIFRAEHVVAVTLEKIN